MRLRHRIAASGLARVFSGIAHRRHSCHDGLLKVLIYHDVPEADLGVFAKQVEYISAQYGFVTPDDVKNVIAGRLRYAGTRVLLTFDDGFRSNAVVAERVLDPLGIKALFFIPPGFIEAESREEQCSFIAENIFLGGLGPGPISESMAPMTWEQLKHLLARGHSIGAHTINHRRLTEITDERELRKEIIGSGDILQQRLGAAIDHFAYPFGGIESIDRRAKAIVRERYACCHSGIRGVNVGGTDPHSLLRDAVSVSDPISYIKFIVGDGLGLMYRKRASMLARY